MSGLFNGLRDNLVNFFLINVIFGILELFEFFWLEFIIIWFLNSWLLNFCIDFDSI